LILSSPSPSSLTGGVLSSLEQVVYFNQVNHKKFIVDVCSETIFTFHYAMFLQKRSHLLHNFDLQIADFQTIGLINNLERKYVQMEFMVEKQQAIPKALTMHQLVGSFQILLIGLGAAAIAFVGEILTVKVKRWMKVL
jgi:hypothetical protein